MCFSYTTKYLNHLKHSSFHGKTCLVSVLPLLVCISKSPPSPLQQRNGEFWTYLNPEGADEQIFKLKHTSIINKSLTHQKVYLYLSEHMFSTRAVWSRAKTGTGTTCNTSLQHLRNEQNNTSTFSIKQKLSWRWICLRMRWWICFLSQIVLKHIFFIIICSHRKTLKIKIITSLRSTIKWTEK